MASDPVVHPPKSRKGGAGKWRTWIALGMDPSTGKYKTKSVVYWADGKTEARRIASEKEAEFRTAAGNDRVAATFSTLLDRYLHDDPDDLRDTTSHTYRQYVENHIRPELGNRLLIELAPTDFAQLRTRLLGKKLSPSSVNQCLSVCRSVCRYGVEGLGWLSTNPAKIKRAKQPKRRVHATTAEEYQAVIADLRQRGRHKVRTFVQMAAYTGARRGELCGLRWSDLDDGSITIQRAVDKDRNVTPTKTHAARTIPLQSEALAVLDEWRLLQLARIESLEGFRRRNVELDWYIWPNDANPTEPSLPGEFTGALRDYPIRLHGLRHLAATLMIGGGIDARAAADRLGHSSPVVTLDVYASSTGARDIAAGKSISDGLKP